MNKEFIPYEQALALKKLVKLKPMNKEFCTYSQSIALKELGFDEPCLAVYNNPEFMWARQLKGWEDHELDNVTNSIYAEGGFVTAPTYSQAINFLYICSNKQIDIKLKGSDTYEERIRKIKQGCKDLRNLQNNKRIENHWKASNFCLKYKIK